MESQEVVVQVGTVIQITWIAQIAIVKAAVEGKAKS